MPLSCTMPVVRAHLIDGTFELFRSFFGAPGVVVAGREVGAVRALVRNFAAWLRSGEVTHVGAAFDTVIESFRNELFAGYKTGEGLDPRLTDQFPLAEQATAALGIAVWGMIELEADDALATAAARLATEPEITQVVIASPDKDLCQCVRGDRVITLDRMRSKSLDEAGVIEKFGVPPASIPDLLALIGDDADGVPGLAKWGARSAAAVLARWGRVDAIPDDPAAWQVNVRGAPALAESLRAGRADAMLYRTLTTLRTDAPIDSSLEHLRWRGADGDALAALLPQLDLTVSDLRLAIRSG
jgi:5'-3' exonuclease